MILDRVHAYVVGLMGFNDQKVIQARYNVENTNYTDDLILIDVLSTAPTGVSNIYDSTLESMKHVTQYKGIFTFDFYGDNAYANAYKFSNLLKSQSSFELASDNLLSIYHASTVTDLKNLQGAKFYERYQVEVSIMYFEETDVATLRIDTAQTDFINDKR